jgi:hypothetical protein
VGRFRFWFAPKSFQRDGLLIICWAAGDKKGFFHITRRFNKSSTPDLHAG